jgi:hypothetical protein
MVEKRTPQYKCQKCHKNRRFHGIFDIYTEGSFFFGKKSIFANFFMVARTSVRDFQRHGLESALQLLTENEIKNARNKRFQKFC